ncbi:MAG: hypothetical protein LBH72_07715 [Proteiniphilum sp.]|nr:hypothetical protein [Proteiniphilum sp.]
MILLIYMIYMIIPSLRDGYIYNVRARLCLALFFFSLVGAGAPAPCRSGAPRAVDVAM